MDREKRNEWARDHAAKKHQEGICERCPNQLNLYGWLCDECYPKFLERLRRLRGCKKWEPGKAGRHPFWATNGLTRLQGVGKCKECRVRLRVLYEDGICLPCILEMSKAGPEDIVGTRDED